MLDVGHRMGPAEIAVMATFGYRKVKVYRKPSVAIVATGDELVEFDQTPRRIKSGTRMRTVLPANCDTWILKRITLELRRTTKKSFGRKCSWGLERDVLIITGGVSMGEYDFVQDVFHDLGLEILFSKVAIKPGKPTVFARTGR